MKSIKTCFRCGEPTIVVPVDDYNIQYHCPVHGLVGGTIRARRLNFIERFGIWLRNRFRDLVSWLKKTDRDHFNFGLMIGIFILFPIAMISGFGLITFLDYLNIHENIIGIAQAFWLGGVGYLVLTSSIKFFIKVEEVHVE